MHIDSEHSEEAAASASHRWGTLTIGEPTMGKGFLWELWLQLTGVAAYALVF
jgi:hypothetical protein